VAKHLNFRRAAEGLCLTQPAVTPQIKALEQHLGVQLFDRSGARISLTPAGSVLLRYAASNDEAELVERFSSAQQPVKSPSQKHILMPLRFRLVLR
jgi:DNA-binding transcriptional LysR family regulator